MPLNAKSSFFLIILWCIFITSNAFSSEKKSDKKAQRLARETVDAMGGRAAYDNTRYLTWRFFGGRFHLWDKYTGDIRIEDGKGLFISMNINTKKGQAWRQGKRVEDSELLNEILDKGYKWWINDSYWLVMPYKLEDPGVTLSYSRKDRTDDGKWAEVLTLTFNDVGVTPENKYEVFIDQKSKLVTQWRFFSKAADLTPSFTTPWHNWQQYADIMLSDNRGAKGHTDVNVLDRVAKDVFTSPSAVSDRFATQ